MLRRYGRESSRGYVRLLSETILLVLESLLSQVRVHSHRIHLLLIILIHRIRHHTVHGSVHGVVSAHLSMHVSAC